MMIQMYDRYVKYSYPCTRLHTDIHTCIAPLLGTAGCVTGSAVLSELLPAASGSITPVFLIICKVSELKEITACKLSNYYYYFYVESSEISNSPNYYVFPLMLSELSLIRRVKHS